MCFSLSLSLSLFFFSSHCFIVSLTHFFHLPSSLLLHTCSYGNFLANEASPVAVSTVSDKLTEKFVNEFTHLRNHAVEPLATFLDYITYGYWIDNIILLITGTLHERDLSELLPKCHPLGLFESMGSLTIATSPTELYNSVLVDTPIGETSRPTPRSTACCLTHGTFFCFSFSALLCQLSV